VVLGKHGAIYDVELGIVPTYDFKKTLYGVHIIRADLDTVGRPTTEQNVFIAGDGSAVWPISPRASSPGVNFCGRCPKRLARPMVRRVFDWLDWEAVVNPYVRSGLAAGTSRRLPILPHY